MKKLIALTVVQFAARSKLVEVKPGEPFIMSDEKQIKQLIDGQAAREASDDEVKRLFTDSTITAGDEPVGVADLSKLSKDELVGYAAEKGITVDPKAVKAEILSTIESHDELGDEGL